MKVAGIAIVFLSLGLCIGSFSHPITAHAQKGLRSAHIIEVNMDPSTGQDYTFNGTPLGLSCIAGRTNPRCFVLVQGN